MHYIETDVRVTKDGVAVLSHDVTFTDGAGKRRSLRRMTVEDIRSKGLRDGGYIPTLIETLLALGDMRFNIDIKERAAVGPTVRAVTQANASHRVLITSFSRRRRIQAARKLPTAFTGAGQADVLRVLLLALLGRDSALARLGTQIHAVQVPGSALMRRLLSPPRLARIQAGNIEVHVWTLNTSEDLERWLKLGVDGVVTDEAKLALDLTQVSLSRR